MKVIRVGREEVVWLWIAIEPKTKSILDMRISLERRSILVAEQFLQELIKKKYGNIQFLLMMVVHGIHKHVDF